MINKISICYLHFLTCSFFSNKANFGISEFELARKDFKKALEIDPKNKAAHDQLKAVINKIKEQDAKERKKYGKSFLYNAAVCLQVLHQCFVYRTNVQNIVIIFHIGKLVIKVHSDKSINCNLTKRFEELLVKHEIFFTKFQAMYKNRKLKSSLQDGCFET